MILDLDHTVLHAAKQASLEEFGPLGLDWEYNAVEAKGGMVAAGHAKLPDLPSRGAAPGGGGGGGGGGGRYLLSFGEVDRYLLQLRPGWEQLRAFLAQASVCVLLPACLPARRAERAPVPAQTEQEPRRFSTSVCTHGRSFYMQTAWRVLDPGGALIPRQEWGQRLRCARPDTAGDLECILKTPLFGTGVAELQDPLLDVRFGPLTIIEDNEEVRAREGRAPAAGGVAAGALGCMSSRSRLAR